ncbi:MAG: hypothetical protein ACJZ14_02645, partial [Candidatus Neomarinimicrobiota bacterium]
TMKRLLMFVLILFIVGYFKSIDNEYILDLGGIKYKQDSQKLYVGELFRLYENNGMKLEESFEDGK